MYKLQMSVADEAPRAPRPFAHPPGKPDASPVSLPEKTRDLAARLRTAASLEEAFRLRNEIIECNLGLVDHVVRRLGWAAQRDDDCWSEGACALVECAARFDPGRGADFPSFAIPRIRGRILTWFHCSASVTGNSGLGRRICKLRRAQRELPAGTDDSAAALAARTGIPVRTVRKFGIFVARPVSLDGIAISHLEADGADPREARAREDRLAELRAALATLPARSRRIVIAAFGLDGGVPRVHQEIAAELNLTRQRVDQLCCAALAQLRRRLER